MCEGSLRKSYTNSHNYDYHRSFKNSALYANSLTLFTEFWIIVINFGKGYLTLCYKRE